MSAGAPVESAAVGPSLHVGPIDVGGPEILGHFGAQFGADESQRGPERADRRRSVISTAIDELAAARPSARPPSGWRRLAGWAVPASLTTALGSCGHGALKRRDRGQPARPCTFTTRASHCPTSAPSSAISTCPRPRSTPGPRPKPNAEPPGDPATPLPVDLSRPGILFSDAGPSTDLGAHVRHLWA